jgi:hypothetical protein
VAFERTLFERLYRARVQAKILPNGDEQYVKWATANLGSNVLNWFDHADEGYAYWLSRFDQWHEYAMRSVDHWMGCQSIDYRQMIGKMKGAALLGILKNLGELPENRIEDLLDEVNSTETTRKVFLKNSKKRRTTPPNLEFESWLIESWPLVLEYGWSYRDIQRVANERFDNDPSIQRLIEVVKDIKKRCKKIGLEQSPARRIKVGRPSQAESSLQPRMFPVAMRIDGLEDLEWFWGKADGTFNGFESLPHQS